MDYKYNKYKYKYLTFKKSNQLGGVINTNFDPDLSTKVNSIPPPPPYSPPPQDPAPQLQTVDPPLLPSLSSLPPPPPYSPLSLIHSTAYIVELRYKMTNNIYSQFIVYGLPTLEEFRRTYSLSLILWVYLTVLQITDNDLSKIFNMLQYNVIFDDGTYALLTDTRSLEELKIVIEDGEIKKIVLHLIPSSKYDSRLSNLVLSPDKYTEKFEVIESQIRERIKNFLVKNRDQRVEYLHDAIINRDEIMKCSQTSTPIHPTEYILLFHSLTDNEFIHIIELTRSVHFLTFIIKLYNKIIRYQLCIYYTSATSTDYILALLKCIYEFPGIPTEIRHDGLKDIFLSYTRTLNLFSRDQLNEELTEIISKYDIKI